MAKTTRDIDVRVRLKDADKFKKGMQEVGGGLSNLNGWLDVTKGILGSQIITKGLGAIKEAFSKCTEESIKFESAMAGLQKTAGLSDVSLGDMSNKIMDMSERLPMSSEEIAKLADEFAHLGLQKDAILPFTEVMIRMADTTDMSASEAGTALAQLANVMGTSIDDYERLGSTILYLGMTSATTESNITEMGQQLSMVGALYGMSEADVLAYAAALSSIGVEAAAGSTSIQKLGNRIELMVGAGNMDEIAKWADVAGMTADAFAKMWEENPAGAINEFIVGLGKINESGGSATVVLDELGISESRVQKNISGLAAAGDLLTRTLENGQKAWAENSTLAEASGIVYSTTASQMTMAENAIQNAQIAVGDGFKGVRLDVKQAEADVAKSIRKMIDADSLGKQMDEIESKFADTNSQIVEARTSTDYLLTSLETMGDIDAADVEQQEKRYSLIMALADIVPGIADLYNEQTGEIEGGTEALRDFINTAFDAKQAETDTLMNSEKTEAYMLALEKRKDLTVQIAEAESVLAAKEKAQWDYYNSHYNADMPDLWNPENDIAYLNLIDETDEAQRALDDLNETQAELNGYLDEYAGVTDDAAQSTNELNAANAKLSGTNGEANDSLQGTIDTLGIYNQELQEAVAAYEAYRETVSKKIEGTIGGLGEIKYSGDTDFETVQNNMADRLKFLTEYQDNLKKAQEMGYDSTFLQQFTDGTVDSAEALAGLVQASDEQVQQMNTDYATMKTQAEELATALATSATGIDETVADVKTAVETLVAGTAVDLTANGKDAIQTLIDGMNSQIGALGVKISTVNKMMARLNRGYAGLGSGKTGGGPTLQTHAQGLGRVPYNDYPALLHEGEMVLTRAEAAAYRAEQFMRSGARAMMDMRGGMQNSYETRNSQTVNFGTIVVREEADVEKIAKKIAELNARNAYGRGVRRR